jgi:MFS transporter, PAT family, beta-lactamase induction signal transducer AmpG
VIRWRAVSLAEQRWLRIFTLCVLYVAQGIPWGFMAATLPGYLVSKGLDFGFVTTTLSFTTLPYAFKWVWGPIIDTITIRRFGRRRPWIVFAQLMMGATIAAMLALDVATEIKLLAWTVFIHTVFNALQDVAVDALAVDLLPDHERGSANGLMYASKYLGGAMGGVGMAKLIAWYGLDTGLIAQASVLFLIMLVPLLVRERDGEQPPRVAPREFARDLQQAFSLRSTLVAALLMLTANFAIGLISATGFSLFITQLKWPSDKYAEITGGWGLIAGMLSAAAAGTISDRIGRKLLVTLAALGLALNWLVFGLMPDQWTNYDYIFASAIIENIMTAGFSVGLITLCMDVSWPRVGGSQFTAYMALSNVSTTLGFLFAGRAQQWLTYEGIWMVGATCQVAVLLLLLPIDAGQTRRDLPYPPGMRVPRAGTVALLGLLVFLIGVTGYMTYQKLG